MESFTAQLKAILLKAGCRFERQDRGDHEIWYSPITEIRFPVDGKLNDHQLKLVGLNYGLKVRIRVA